MLQAGFKYIFIVLLLVELFTKREKKISKQTEETKRIGHTSTQKYYYD